MCSCQALFELSTNELTEEAFKNGEKEARLVVEAQDEGWLARVLVPEGEKDLVKVGRGFQFIRGSWHINANMESQHKRVPGWFL